MGTPNWLEEEQKRASKINVTNETNNNDAPRIVKVKREPIRKQKAFYIQEIYASTFEDLAYKQKKSKGKTAPQLAEEALLMLFEKYEHTI